MGAPCLLFVLAVLFVAGSAISQAEAVSCGDVDLVELWKDKLCVDGCTCEQNERLRCEVGGIHADLSNCGIELSEFIANLRQNPPPVGFFSLNLADNKNIRKVEASTFADEHFKYLRVLNLRSNFDCYKADTFSHDAFKGLDYLQSLFLSIKPDTCDSSHFQLSLESVRSLTKNLTELHVTGSHLMTGLRGLGRLSVLNLGGKGCNLTHQSNLSALSELNLDRLSMRLCVRGEAGFLTGLPGFPGFIRSVRSLVDVSCASITFLNIHCYLADSVQTLIIDQDNRFRYHETECNWEHQRPSNLTAVSLANYYGLLREYDVIPVIDATFFPCLAQLILSHNQLPVLNDTYVKALLSSGLDRLESLDISNFGTNLASPICLHIHTHPWFNFHMEFKECNYSLFNSTTGAMLPPRLTKLMSRNNKLSLLSRISGPNCSFTPNALREVDISGNRGPAGCSSGIIGLQNVRKVISKGTEFTDCNRHPTGCFNIHSILSLFPNMTDLNLEGSGNVMPLTGLHHPHLQSLCLNHLKGNTPLLKAQRFEYDVANIFPDLINFSLAENKIENVTNCSLPHRLTFFNLSHNSIYVFSQAMRVVLDRHSRSEPGFTLDIRGNNIVCGECKCNATNLKYLKWVTESAYILSSSKCFSEGKKTVVECVKDGQCVSPREGSQNLIIGVAAGVAGFLIIIVIVSFIVFKRYHWRIRFCLRKFCNLPYDSTSGDMHGKRFYLSYCTEDDAQSNMAYRIWQFVQNGNLPVDVEMKSRWDINPGQLTNEEVTRHIEDAHKVLLLMPDEQYSQCDSSMYELQLALSFHDIQDICPITAEGVSDLEGIAVRFPPLIAPALEAYCRPIYPLSADDPDISSFFDNVLGIQQAAV